MQGGSASLALTPPTTTTASAGPVAATAADEVNPVRQGFEMSPLPMRTLAHDVACGYRDDEAVLLSARHLVPSSADREGRALRRAVVGVVSGQWRSKRTRGGHA